MLSWTAWAGRIEDILHDSLAPAAEGERGAKVAVRG